MKRLSAFLLLLATACATAPPPPPAADLDDQIIARGDEFLRVWAAKDVDAAAAMFTQDAQFTSPGMATVVGRPAIRKQIASTIEMNVKHTVTRDSVDVTGTRARERGKYEIRLGLFVTRGTYTIDWRRESGVWRIAKYVAE